MLVAFLTFGRGLELKRVRIGGHELPLEPTGRSLVISQASPTVQVDFNILPIPGFHVGLDGKSLPLEGGWPPGRRTATPEPLADGPHELTLQTGDRHRVWRFNVDTRPPEVEILSPAQGAFLSGNTGILRGKSEAGSEIEARNGEARVQTRPASDGSFSLEVPIRHGPNAIRWEARDAAGNRRTGTLEISCDQTPPRLELSLDGQPGGQDGELVVGTGSPLLRIQALDPESGLAGLEVRVDAGKTRPVPLPAEGKAAEIRLPGLPDGLRKVEVQARNQAGGLSTGRLEFLVDSTEEFGRATLTLGARGRDVEELQRRLADQGYLRSADIAGHFGEPTRQAVRALQEELGLRVDGMAGPYTIAALSSRIYVNLAEFSLVLVDWKGEEHTWPIAHGTPDHPTPTGSFVVADLARDPTWIPPDSPWAREARVTPPGPGNPLGTRWIGLDHGLVGIHGTPAEWTIGSRASHGCVRMTVPDIEDLFERVNLGTPVRILAGNEADPVVSRFWP